MTQDYYYSNFSWYSFCFWLSSSSLIRSKNVQLQFRVTDPTWSPISSPCWLHQISKFSLGPTRKCSEWLAPGCGSEGACLRIDSLPSSCRSCRWCPSSRQYNPFIESSGLHNVSTRCFFFLAKVFLVVFLDESQRRRRWRGRHKKPSSHSNLVNHNLRAHHFDISMIVHLVTVWMRRLQVYIIKKETIVFDMSWFKTFHSRIRS